MKRIISFSRFLYWLQILLLGSLVLGYLAPFISPKLFWPLAFFGLALPYLLILNLLFVFYWALKGNKMFFISLVFIALGYRSITALVQFNFQKQTPASEDAFKVLSFNVRVFDLYQWSKEKETRNKILDFLKKEDPDILCMQEFFHRDQQQANFKFKTLDTLVELLTAKNYHFHKTISLRNNDHWGIITLSKFPIINKGVVEFDSKSDNICIYTDLLYGEDTLRIYNGHLASIKLDKHDYKAIQGLNKNEYSSNFGKEKLIFQKLKQSFRRRAIQSESIRQSISTSPFPVIFCGDLNDTPSSFAYRQIKGNLNDAFTEFGEGLGRTYIGDFPSFRIDYIFYSRQFIGQEYNTHPEKLSDHHPISAKFTFKKE